MSRAWKRASAEKSNNSQQSSDRSSSKRQFRGMTVGETALNLGAFVSFAFLGAVAFYNVWLYQQIFSNLLPLPWPALQWLFGLFGWALIQIAELMPTLIYGELAFMALIAVAISSFRQVEDNGSSSAAVRRLRDRINSYPDHWLMTANIIGSIVFILDVFMVSLHFEPLTWTFFIPSIDLIALIQVIVTVLMFQAAFAFALWNRGGRWFVGNARRQMGG